MTASPDLIGGPDLGLARDRARALARVSLLPGSHAKTFVRGISTALERGADISEAQAKYLEALAWRFRRQMPRRLVPESNR